jgi:hypothetical protein
MAKRRGQMRACNGLVPYSGDDAQLDAAHQTPAAKAPSDRLSACKLTSGPQRSHPSIAARDGGASEDKGNLP